VILRIHFDGSNAACAKWLPFAKKKLASLSRRYKNRKTWTWERTIQGARISLEQNNGKVQYIRIKSGVTRYEFTSAFSLDNQLRDIKFGLVRPARDEEGVRELQLRDHNGAPIGEPDEDEFIDQQDVYLFGTDWPIRLDEGDNNTYPMIDWFGGSYAITTPSDGDRHKNQTGIYALINGGVGTSFYGSYANTHLQYRTVTGRPVLHRKDHASQRLMNIGTTVYTAAIQAGRFIAGCDGSGEQYQFFFYDLETEYYYPIDLTALRPDEINRVSRTRWHWNRTGNKCLSIQYDPYSTAPEALNQVVVDRWLHEINIDVEGVDEDENIEYVAEDSFVTHDHYPYHPVAADYDINDGQTRRILVLEPWVGPLFERLEPWADYYGTDDHCRSLLIYAHFCTIDDNGQISSPERTFPVYHKPWLSLLLADEPSEEDDEYGYNPTYVGTATGCQVFADRFGHHGFSSRIAALDMRAQAIALYTQIQHEIYPGPEDWTMELETEYNKRWTIWGEEGFREDAWMNRAGAIYVPGAINPIDSVATPPADYTRLQPGHPLFHPQIIGWDLNPIFEEIIRNMLNSDNLISGCNGFRISKEKHFALFVNDVSGFYTLPTPPQSGIVWNVEIPEAARDFLRMDHVEWYRSGNPMTSTHYDLFNEARGTVHAPGDDSLGTMCANGFWGR
jgi:hypothetical protein